MVLSKTVASRSEKYRYFDLNNTSIVVNRLIVSVISSHGFKESGFLRETRILVQARRSELIHKPLDNLSITIKMGYLNY